MFLWTTKTGHTNNKLESTLGFDTTNKNENVCFAYLRRGIAQGLIFPLE